MKKHTLFFVNILNKGLELFMICNTYYPITLGSIRLWCVCTVPVHPYSLSICFQFVGVCHEAQPAGQEGGGQGLRPQVLFLREPLHHHRGHLLGWVIGRVADSVWYWPDPDPTSQDRPDPGPDTSVLQIFHLLRQFLLKNWCLFNFLTVLSHCF